MSDTRICLGCLEQLSPEVVVCTNCGLPAHMKPFWSPDAAAAPVVGRAEDLASVEIDGALLNILPKSVCERHTVIPIERTAVTLTVAAANPFDRNAVDDLVFLTGLTVRLVVVPARAIREAIRRWFS